MLHDLLTFSQIVTAFLATIAVQRVAAFPMRLRGRAVHAIVSRYTIVACVSLTVYFLAV
jgi:hypothetical protein